MDNFDDACLIFTDPCFEPIEGFEHLFDPDIMDGEDSFYLGDGVSVRIAKKGWYYEELPDPKNRYKELIEHLKNKYA